MNAIEAAILRTILYADVFNYPLTLEEIHHYLIHHEPVALEVIQDTLATSPRLHSALIARPPYYLCRERENLIAVRAAREAAADYLWPLALRYGRWLARLPFVRMVALTGALAVRNASNRDDDLDYLLVTHPGRVWIARAFAILLVRYGRLRGVEVCPNYVLAADMLEQARQDTFMAHELAQMVPLYGRATYDAMRCQNTWTAGYLPNARTVLHREAEYRPGAGWRIIKRALELLLSGPPGNLLERWEYQRKRRRFEAGMQQPHSSARIDTTQVKGHFNDNGHPTLQKYAARLREYGIDGVQSSLIAAD